MAAKELKLFSTQQCLAGFEDISFEIDAIHAWKKAARKGVDGAPIVLIDGARVEPPMTVKEWEARFIGHVD